METISGKEKSDPSLEKEKADEEKLEDETVQQETETDCPSLLKIESLTPTSKSHQNRLFSPMRCFSQLLQLVFGGSLYARLTVSVIVVLVTICIAYQSEFQRMKLESEIFRSESEKFKSQVIECGSKDGVYKHETGKCYIYSSEPMEFYAAVHYCYSHKYTLAYPKSKQEIDFLRRWSMFTVYVGYQRSGDTFYSTDGTTKLVKDSFLWGENGVNNELPFVCLGMEKGLNTCKEGKRHFVCSFDIQL